MRPWTTSEEEALRHLAHLGARALAEAFDRPMRSIENKARRLGVSLEAPRLLRILRRAPAARQACAAPASSWRRRSARPARKRPAGVRRTGFCWRCHLEALRAVHEEEIARLEGQRALWAARSKLQRRRRSAETGEDR